MHGLYVHGKLFEPLLVSFVQTLGASQVQDILSILLIWITTFFALFVVLVVWVALIIASSLLTRSFRHRARDAGLDPSAVNGVVLATRLIIFFIGFAVLFIALPPPMQSAFASILGGSSLLLGTAVGLAVGQAVKNLVSGVYVMFTHPFRVQDYVRIADSEGIVEEINMNYTKIMQPDRTEVLVPNTKVLETSVTNFTIEKKQLQSEEDRETDPLRKRILRSITHAMEVERFIRYTTTLRFPLSLKVDSLTKAFDGICERWTKKFSYRPVFELSATTETAFSFIFTIFADDPLKILDQKAEFLSDVVHSVYT